MIDKRELRIGNIILADYDVGEVLEVWQEQIRFRKLHPLSGFDDVEIIHLNNVHPVPLTPELMEKCCNNKTTDGGYRIAISEDRMQSLFIYKSLAGWVAELFSFGTSKPLPILHSLHQLQNLIYILSGNELNVEI